MPKSSRPGRSVITVAAVVILGAVIAVGIFAGRGQNPPPVAIARGPAVPSLSGTDPISGAPVSLESFRGHPLVINLWASWCPGCNVEAPDIRRFTATHREIGFVGINVNDTPAAARQFVAKYGWTHSSISDPSGALGARLGLQGLPTTIFVRADGTIAGQVPGQVTFQQLVTASNALGS